MKLAPWSSARLSLTLLLAATALAAFPVACATENAGDFQLAPTNVAIPEADAGDDGGDAGIAGACTGDDCAFFASECTADVLCPVGPFDPVDPARGLPWPTKPRALVGRSPNDIWFAGSLGVYSHFDGSSWTTVDAGTQTSARAFWLTPSGEVALTDHASLLVRGSSFVTTGAPSAGGFAGAELKNRPGGFGSRVTAGFAPAGSSTFWLATDTTLFRLGATPDGEIEVQARVDPARCGALCEEMRSVHGSSMKTLFAVGERGATVRIDDADSDSPKVTLFDSGTMVGLWGVFASSDTEVWSVGGLGTVRRFAGDGNVWEAVTGIPTEGHLSAIWGRSASDIWVAGDKGVVLHYDGVTWSRVVVAGLGARRPALTNIWGTDGGAVYIAGQGIVLSLGGTP